MAITIAEQTDLTAATRVLIERCAQVLRVPVALLSSQSGEGWRFEGDEIPSGASPGGAGVLDPTGALRSRSDQPWTGIVIGTVRDREWMLMVPGGAEVWRSVRWLESFIDEIRWSLERVALTDDERRQRRFARQVYAFSRRLARRVPASSIHELILRTIAGAVHARTGSLAIHSQSENVLTIACTIGYPSAIVEHVSVTPGQGILGRAVLSRKPVLGTARDPHRRLRYRSDSYLLQPLVHADRTLAVVALTDRADGRPFDVGDLAATRILAAPAALALSRERMHDSIHELTRAATVDPVTGLFNRRYFEDRLQAELQRARRQQHSLALMIVDIDDFKRINDTFGHLAGDRALRDVAELLRGGVRIFDDCARFGGEEFTILMPGASAEMAVQAAERIRRRIEDWSRHDDLPITVSVGVAMLGDSETSDELIGAADHALIAAKQAGKNRVQMDR